MKNTFKKLFDTKFKKVVWFIFATIIFLCAVFIRTVPNYTAKYGFEIVNLFDYNKYNQGYCLAENRILDKEELYKRAITQFLEKYLIMEQKWDKARVYVYGSSWKSKVEIGYYELDDDINLDNWLEKIVNDYKDLYIPIKDIKAKAELDEKAVRKLLFDKLKIQYDDILESGNGNDVLIGLDGADTLKDSAGDDIYLVGDKDIIEDSDGIGMVVTLEDGNILKGGIYYLEENAYLGFDGISKYYLDETANTLMVKTDNKEITINNFDINHKDKTGRDFLGIALIKGKEMVVNVNLTTLNPNNKFTNLNLLVA